MAHLKTAIARGHLDLVESAFEQGFVRFAVKAAVLFRIICPRPDGRSQCTRHLDQFEVIGAVLLQGCRSVCHDLS